MTNIFKGLGVALITPFHSDFSIDWKSLDALIDHQLKGKIDFLCILGTTSEVPCLSLQERRDIIAFVVNKVKGRIPLLLGCGGNNTAEVIRYIQTEDLEGIDGLLVVTPYYNKPSQEGLYQHYKAIANATTLPVVLYNVPSRTGVNLEAETTLRLAHDVANIVAVKEASGLIAQVQDILEEKPADFDVISGDDGITFELLLMGAKGVISVVGNALPKEFAHLTHQCLQGNLNGALPIHRGLHSLFKLLTVDGNPSGIKALLSEMQFIENTLRLPLVPAKKQTQVKIREVLKNLDLSGFC